MKYSRYFEARYVCYNHLISTIYVSGILQKYYTYHLPDMCEYYCYSIHISGYIQSYRVPDRYPIISILTCGEPYKKGKIPKSTYYDKYGPNGTLTKAAVGTKK